MGILIVAGGTTWLVGFGMLRALFALRHGGDGGGVVGRLQALGLAAGRHPDLSDLVVHQGWEVRTGRVQARAGGRRCDVALVGHGAVVKELGELGAGWSQARAARGAPYLTLLGHGARVEQLGELGQWVHCTQMRLLFSRAGWRGAIRRCDGWPSDLDRLGPQRCHPLMLLHLATPLSCQDRTRWNGSHVFVGRSLSHGTAVDERVAKKCPSH